MQISSIDLSGGIEPCLILVGQLITHFVIIFVQLDDDGLNFFTCDQHAPLQS